MQQKTLRLVGDLRIDTNKAADIGDQIGGLGPVACSFLTRSTWSKRTILRQRNPRQ